MNSRAQPPLAAGTRRASFRLLLWLAPAVAISAPSVAPQVQVASLSRPYLAIVGAPALRFAERTSSQPDSTSKLPSGAPPQPGRQDPSNPNSAIQNPADVKTEPGITPAHDDRAADSTVVISSSPGKDPSGNPPVPILPDDVRSKVRPEDFVPFFQFPGANHQINTNSSPTGPSIPSSATYRQQ